MLHADAVLAGAAFIGGGVVFGLIIGRWWALLVPPAVGWILFETTPNRETTSRRFRCCWPFP